MKNRLLPVLVVIAALVLAGCSALGSIPYSPPTTPGEWLAMQPYTEIRSVLVVQPSTSAIVYLLGVISILAGLYFFRIRGAEKSRVWWGIALLLWGAGALFAGSSYEAFSYQLKCAGREVCTWTHWMEVVYLVLSLGSVDAMLMAEAYACTTGQRRQRLMGFAWSSFGFYLLLVLTGSLVPIKFLISFELLILMAVPNVVIFLYLNARRYWQTRERMDLYLLVTWGWLILTIAAYFLYYLSDIAENLWERGMWFTENDVLHIGLIILMAYIGLVVARQVKDEKETMISF